MVYHTSSYNFKLVKVGESRCDRGNFECCQEGGGGGNCQMHGGGYRYDCEDCLQNGVVSENTMGKLANQYTKGH